MWIVLGRGSLLNRNTGEEEGINEQGRYVDADAINN